MKAVTTVLAALLMLAGLFFAFGSGMTLVGELSSAGDFFAAFEGEATMASFYTFLSSLLVAFAGGFVGIAGQKMGAVKDSAE